MKVASDEKRRIPKATMKDVVEYLPIDAFKLNSDILGSEYTVVDVVHSEYAGRKNFTVGLQNDDHLIYLSAGLLKRMRVLGNDATIKDEDFFKDNKGIATKVNALDVWNNSRYFHSEEEMKEEDYVLPEKIHIEFAVIATNQDGEPIVNPFNYKGYNAVVTDYQKRKEFPTFEQFKEELAKTGDTRIKALPTDLLEPVLNKGLSYDDPNIYRSHLIAKDIKRS